MGVHLEHPSAGFDCGRGVMAWIDRVIQLEWLYSSTPSSAYFLICPEVGV